MTTNRTAAARARGLKQTGSGLALGLLAGAALLGCAGPSSPRPAAARAAVPPVEVRTEMLALQLTAIRDQGAPDTLVRSAGWRDYRLTVTNLGDQPVKVSTVKLRDADGRYVAGAGGAAELDAPPDVATRVAGDLALRGVGIAAGEAIPYGGSVVGILSGAARANAAQQQAERQRRFALRNLRDLELAPGARFTGSAYLPDLPNPAAIAVDWQPLGGSSERIELALPGAGSRTAEPPR